MGAPNLDDPFFGELRALAAAMRVPAAWILLIFWIESGLQPHPPHNAKFPDYFGLNQMNGGYLRRVGVDPLDYETWTASEQLSRVIGPWLSSTAAQVLGGQPAPTAGALYAVNFLPGRVHDRGTSDDTVLTRDGDRDYADKQGVWHSFIEANRGLDANHDGAITIGDLNAFLAKHASDSGFVGQLLRLGVDDVPLPETDDTPEPAPDPAPSSGSSSSSSSSIFPAVAFVLLGGALLLGRVLARTGARAPLTGRGYL